MSDFDQTQNPMPADEEQKEGVDMPNEGEELEDLATPAEEEVPAEEVTTTEE